MTANPSQSTIVAIVHNGQEVYDAIMRMIEPELTSDQIPLLEEKYKDETQEERTKRIEKYNKAFAEYDIAVAAFTSELKSQTEANRRNALSSAERKTRVEEEEKLQQIESLFS